jgi:competence protein ComEC
MTRACLLLLAGMYAPQLSSFALDSDHVPAALLAAFILLVLERTRPFAWVILGIALFGSAVHGVIESRVAPGLVGESLLTTVRVTDFPRVGEGGVTFTAAPVDDVRLPARIRVSWFEPPVVIRLHDVWRLELRLRRPRAAANPGGTDLEAWFTRERIGATGYVVASRRNHLLGSGKGGAVSSLRLRFVTRVTALIAEPDRAAVLAALVVGARHLMTPAQWDRFARTGTSHLMAISGLHVGLAAAGGYGLMRVAAVTWRGRGNPHRAAIVASIATAIAYTLVSGLAVPSRRASLMILLAGLALLRRRRPQPATILSAAALALALADPLATMAAGFKLSFAAVAVLLWQAKRHVPARGPIAALGQLATLQVLLLLGLLPLVGALFARVPLAAPVTNLVAVPVFSFITVPLALAGLALDGPLEPLGDACIELAALSIGIVDSVVTAGAAADGLARELPAIAGAGWLWLLAPVLWLLLPPGWPGRGVAWLGFSALLLYAPPRPDPGCATIDVLDVGQGLAAMVRTRGRTLLYDTGPAYRNGGTAAETVLLPYMISRAIRRIDTLVVSHGDVDHAGGLQFLLESVAVDDVLSGEPERLGLRRARRCTAGEAWHWDGIDFRLLHPPAGAALAGNDASCVLLVTAGRSSLLIPGDIERPAEAVLLRDSNPGRVSAVIVPHHGSRTSSSAAFVAALAPAIAIVPVGFANRWGFPKPDVVARWQAAGTTVLTTAEAGAIELELCAAESAVGLRSQRQTRRRIWHE